MSDWLRDKREIVVVRLATEPRDYDCNTGDRFERMEYPGEYCMLPWLRITSQFSARGIYGGPVRTFELPMSQVAMLEFRDAQAGDARRAETRRGSVHEHAVAEGDAPETSERSPA